VAKLKDIMTTDVFSTTRDATVTEVAEAMVKGRFGSAVVIRGSWVDGIFTERDVLRAAASGKDLNSLTVGEWMTQDPMTVGPDMDSEEALQLMASNGFRHLPVVEGEAVLGIVSLRDVMSTRIARAPR
jgi:CBS domain-containing protein